MYTQDDMSVLGIFDEDNGRSVQDYCLEYNLNLEETEVVMNYLSKALNMDVELNTLISDDEFENAYEILIDTQYSFEGLEESKPVSKGWKRLREAEDEDYTLKNLNKGLKACGLKPLESLEDFDKLTADHYQKSLDFAAKNRQIHVICSAKKLNVVRALQISQGVSKKYTSQVHLITKVLYVKKENSSINILAGSLSSDKGYNKMIETNIQSKDKNAIYKTITSAIDKFKKGISTKSDEPDSVFFKSEDDYVLLITKPNTEDTTQKVHNFINNNFSSEEKIRALLKLPNKNAEKGVVGKVLDRIPGTKKQVTIQCDPVSYSGTKDLAKNIENIEFNSKVYVIRINSDDKKNISIAKDLVDEYVKAKDKDKTTIKSFFSKKEPEQVKDVDSKGSEGTTVKKVMDVSDSGKSDSKKDVPAKKSSGKKGDKSVDVSFRDKNIGKFNINQPLVKAVIDLEGLKNHKKKRGALRNQQRKDALRDLLRDWQLISEKVERSGL